MRGFFLLLVLIGCGCAGHGNGDIIPMQGGVNVARAHNCERRQSEKNALETATDHCNDAGKRLAVISMATAYDGWGNEKSHETIRVANSVINAVTFLPTFDTDNGYLTSIEFVCE